MVNRNEAKERIYKALCEIDYCDYHYHWEKDENYPWGSYRDTGTRTRTPLELMCQCNVAGRFIACEGSPVKKRWEFTALCATDEEQAYEIARPLIPQVSNAGKFEAAWRGFKILYDMPDLDLANPTHYWELSSRVKRAYANGLLDWLPEAYAKSRLNRCVNIQNTRYAREHYDALSDKDKERERDLLPGTLRFDTALVLVMRYQHESTTAKWFWEAVQDVNGMPVETHENNSEAAKAYVGRITDFLKSISLDDYMSFVEKVFAFVAERGCHQLKGVSGYNRALDYHKREEKEARAALEKLQSEFIGQGKPIDDFKEEITTFEDFIVYQCLEMAKRQGWHTVQIHTGHRGGDNEELARPKLLEELICANPDMNFIMIHGGKFDYRDVVELCRDYENVSADYSWIPALDMDLGAKMAYEFIKEMPFRTAAGLDMANIEGCAGMADISRELTADTLARLVEERHVDSVDKALEIGRSILSTKPKELFPNSFR